MPRNPVQRHGGNHAIDPVGQAPCASRNGYRQGNHASCDWVNVSSQPPGPGGEAATGGTKPYGTRQERQLNAPGPRMGSDHPPRCGPPFSGQTPWLGFRPPKRSPPASPQPTPLGPSTRPTGSPHSDRPNPNDPRTALRTGPTATDPRCLRPASPQQTRAAVRPGSAHPDNPTPPSIPKSPAKSRWCWSRHPGPRGRPVSQGWPLGALT